jgi:hypothetical protein
MSESHISAESEGAEDFKKLKLQGNFLLVETKLISNKLTDAQISELKKKRFRKLHIVKIKDNIGPLYLNEGNKKS